MRQRQKSGETPKMFFYEIFFNGEVMDMLEER